MPTEDQLASRKAVENFLERVARPVRQKLRTVKSEWFGRPDEELKGWVERGRAISEISDSLGYRLIMSQTDKEIEWAKEQLEIGNLDVTELRMYLRSLRFLKDFVLTTERNADISSKVLAGRAGAIENDTVQFVQNVRNAR